MTKITVRNLRLTGFLLIIALLAGCGNGKKKSTHCLKEECTGSGLPVGPQGSKTSSSIFNEDIEAFVLEEDQPEAAAFNNQLAQNQLDFTWEEHEPNTPKKQVVHFDYDSATIKPDQETVLAADIQEKKELVKKGYNITFVGHSCKWHGTKAYNLALSERRAQSIAQHYENAGIDRKHIKIIGIGDSEPIVIENSKDGQAPNRRVEISALC